MSSSLGISFEGDTCSEAIALKISSTSLNPTELLFDLGEADGLCLSFSASSPVGVAPWMRLGGSNLSSGLSRERGKKIPQPSSHLK